MSPAAVDVGTPSWVKVVVCALSRTFVKPTSLLVVFSFLMVLGAFDKSVSTAPMPVGVTVPPPAPLSTPAALILIWLFLMVFGALDKSVSTAPIPVGVTVPPPAPDNTPPELIDIWSFFSMFGALLPSDLI